MGRPPLNPNEPTLEKKIRAPASWWRRVEEAAREEDVYPSEIIRRIVDERLKG